MPSHRSMHCHAHQERLYCGRRNIAANLGQTESQVDHSSSRDHNDPNKRAQEEWFHWRSAKPDFRQGFSGPLR